VAEGDSSEGSHQMKLSPKTQALDLATQLPKLFHHNNFGFIVADNQVKPDWLTELAYPLSSGELVRLFLDEHKLIGVGFDAKTKYIMLDIDWLSKYHPTHDIDAFRGILNALETIGLTRNLVIRSSDSGGIHIYFPLPEGVPTFQLAASVRVILTDAGYEIKNGHLEIFPNTKLFAKHPGEYSHYKPHRLPLQPESGSYLLEDDGLNPQPIPNTTEAQLAAFLDQWEMAAAGQDIELLKQKLPQLYKKFLARKNRFKYQSREEKTKKAKEWETSLELGIAIGWTGYGQTYSLMPIFLAYGVVFLGLQGEELYQQMYQSIVTAPGYQQYCRHQHEIEKMIRSWIRTNDRTQYYSPYRSKPARNQNYPFGDPKLVKKPQPKPNPANKKTAENALHRIRTAYACLIDKLTPELKIEDLKEMIREQMKKIFNQTCSNSTLTKYKNIWHPKYRKNPNTLSQIQPNDLEDRVTEENSDSLDSLVNGSVETQTLAQRKSEHPQTPMICWASEIQPNINIPTPPRESHYNVVDTYNTTDKPQTPGKFAVLAGALSKIIAVAAIVLNVGITAGIVDAEPAVDETSSTSTPNQTTATTTATTTASFPEPDDLNLPSSEAVLLPCNDPRISPMYFVRYNPNQIGVPWNTAAEFHKFLGYLFIVAKIDKTIQNPWAWAVKSIKNIKERGINSHWLTFTGQQMLDPNSPQVQQLGTIFPQIPPATANVTIDRPSESISKIVGRVRVEPQIDKPEPKRSSPPDPTPITTPWAYQPQQHTSGDICPECSIATPTVELEQWSMCRFCAQKILWRRLI
jgi:hypothetical protein